MNKADFELLYSYNRWANELAFGAASALSPEQFKRAQGNSFSSVRDTLVHIVGAEWIWMERWKGNSPRSLPASDGMDTVESIRAMASEVDGERIKFIGGLTPEDLE